MLNYSHPRPLWTRYSNHFPGNNFGSLPVFFKYMQSPSSQFEYDSWPSTNRYFRSSWKVVNKNYRFARSYFFGIDRIKVHWLDLSPTISNMCAHLLKSDPRFLNFAKVGKRRKCAFNCLIFLLKCKQWSFTQSYFTTSECSFWRGK